MAFSGKSGAKSTLDAELNALTKYECYCMCTVFYTIVCFGTA